MEYAKVHLKIMLTAPWSSEWSGASNFTIPVLAVIRREGGGKVWRDVLRCLQSRRFVDWRAAATITSGCLLVWRQECGGGGVCAVAAEQYYQFSENLNRTVAVHEGEDCCCLPHPAPAFPTLPKPSPPCPSLPHPTPASAHPCYTLLEVQRAVCSPRWSDPLDCLSVSR